MVNINNLKKFGIDVEEVTRQFKGKQEFYIECLLCFPEDNSYEQILVSLKNNDYKSAFVHVRSLKSLVGNLNFSDYYNDLRILTDLLRPCDPVNTTEIITSLKRNHERILEAINFIKQQSS